MHIDVWKTGHEIADRIAETITAQLPYSELRDCRFHLPAKEVNLAYGILRGSAEVFRQSRAWICVDRGYFKPKHYDGYYRLSLNGTQQTRFAPWMQDPKRFQQLGITPKPWRGTDSSKPILICPPTDYVCQFFGIDKHAWIKSVHSPKSIMREKGDNEVLNLEDYSHVITFNSSIGWQALLAGIPCISDTTHSLIGCYLKDSHFDNSIDNLDKQEYYRQDILNIMANLQITLSEIREGHLWELIQGLFGSVGTEEKLSPPMSVNTP